ncbi:uncharacterized protein wdr93 [Kryptolebias marmoratus]|uniref:uncharacterized protein wdr93 n=1 Tax=Kryptolebias marmoratus TaxID=37003 RepID=UPI0007F916E0|nr:uncharacterized protein wdr93 [Kryptolebias marmoratus]
MSREVPLLELPGVAQLPEDTSCLACSEDSRYLALGHPRGLSVWCASSFSRVAEWLQDRLEITLIQMSRMAETTYLLGAVDDMGVARVFALHSNVIHLLSVLNAMEDVNKRSICLTFELHAGGRYGAAVVSCHGAVCLQVLQLPSAAWLKELEAVASQKQDQNLPEETAVQWSPVAVMFKITPPKVPLGGAVDGPLGVGSTADFLAHCFALDVVRSSARPGEKLSFAADAGKTKEAREGLRGCTWHFLLRCGQFSGDSEAHLQPGLPVAVAVWWSGSHNLLQYSLQKAPKNKPDLAPAPDVLWPNAEEIVCSAVSRCSRYIGLGLEDALVCIWDRRTGAPLSIVSVPAENLLRMQFVDNWTPLAAEPVHVLVLCKNGALHSIAAGHGTQSCTVQLPERPKGSRDLPAVMLSVPFLRAVLLVVQRDGKMFLRDVINKTTLCFLSLPSSHRIASPCSPVYALDAKQQVLFIRGDQEASHSASAKKGGRNQLFVFSFGQADIIEQFVVPQPDPPELQPTLCHDALEEICNLYLQQRVLSADERSKALERTWGRLQETAVTIQQRRQGHSHPS